MGQLLVICELASTILGWRTLERAVADGVGGKPVDERMMALALAGTACLLGLVVFVFGLEIHHLFF